jgi:hypothetical protein
VIDLDIFHVLYIITLIVSFIAMAVVTFMVLGGFALFDYIRTRMENHKRKCDDISKHISDIYHIPDKKG